MRPDLRADDALRSVSIQRHFTKYAEGAVLVSFGDTRVVCTATVDETVPSFRKEIGGGWVTAEYAMLPRSTGARISRDAARKGRAIEISRLIGRSLRCVTDLEAMGERQITVDCDVLQADGGTRTAAITGAYVAMHDALQLLVERGKLQRLPLLGQCAAVSIGIIGGDLLLDLCYEEDAMADVDMNVVMRSDGHIIEIQGCAEGDAFPRRLVNEMLDLAEKGITSLFQHQREALAGG